MTDKDFNARLNAIDSRLSYCKDDKWVKIKFSEHCIYNLYNFITRLYNSIPLEMFLKKRNRFIRSKMETVANID